MPMTLAGLFMDAGTVLGGFRLALVHELNWPNKSPSVDRISER